MAKNLIGTNNFIEVYTDSSLATCRERDTKGLYQLAIDGKLRNFTGISSPYEPPLIPDLHLHTDISSVEDCLGVVKAYLTHYKKLKTGYEMSYEMT